MPKQHYVRGGGNRPSRVLIATQVLSGEVSAPFLVALVSSLPKLEEAGWSVDFAIEAGNCHVDDSRNAIVRTFLGSDCTDLVFIDADVGWTTAGLLRLLSHDVDLVAGVYPKKQDEPGFPVRTLPGEIQADENGLVEVEGAPTGFMRIRRPLLERMVDAHKERQFYGSDGGAPYTLLFERTMEDKHRWSGDYAFCRKWRAMGGKLFVDPEMDFIHEGRFEWKGRLGDFWRRQAGLESHRFVAAFRDLLNGNAEPGRFVTLSSAWGNHWAAPPDMLAALHKMAGRVDGPILETGSGLSSLVMAASGATVHALESDLGWFRRVKDTAARYGLDNLHIHYAPLDLGGWYSLPAQLPEQFALVLCDGPNRAVGDRERLWSLPHVERAIWVIDDVCGSEFRGRTTHQFGDAHPWIIAIPGE